MGAEADEELGVEFDPAVGDESRGSLDPRGHRVGGEEIAHPELNIRDPAGEREERLGTSEGDHGPTKVDLADAEVKDPGDREDVARGIGADEAEAIADIDTELVGEG